VDAPPQLMPQAPFVPPPAGSYGYPTAPPASGEAVAALVCAVMASFCFVPGFIAIWLGARARRAARENPTTVGGEQMALAAMIVGGVLGSLQLLFIIAYVVFIAVIGFSAFAARP
jgi:hypothetical protein